MKNNYEMLGKPLMQLYVKIDKSPAAPIPFLDMTLSPPVQRYLSVQCIFEKACKVADAIFDQKLYVTEKGYLLTEVPDTYRTGLEKIVLDFPINENISTLLTFNDYLRLVEMTNYDHKTRGRISKEKIVLYSRKGTLSECKFIVALHKKLKLLFLEEFEFEGQVFK